MIGPRIAKLINTRAKTQIQELWPLQSTPWILHSWEGRPVSPLTIPWFIFISWSMCFLFFIFFLEEGDSFGRRVVIVLGFHNLGNGGNGLWKEGKDGGPVERNNPNSIWDTKGVLIPLPASPTIGTEVWQGQGVEDLKLLHNSSQSSSVSFNRDIWVSQSLVKRE